MEEIVEAVVEVVGEVAGAAASDNKGCRNAFFIILGIGVVGLIVYLVW